MMFDRLRSIRKYTRRSSLRFGNTDKDMLREKQESDVSSVDTPLTTLPRDTQTAKPCKKWETYDLDKTMCWAAKYGDIKIVKLCKKRGSNNFDTSMSLFSCPASSYKRTSP